MISFTKHVLLSAVAMAQAVAGTVVVTSIPDADHPLDPLTSLDGIPLTAGAQVRVGAFPGMSNDQLLNLATGGLAQISAAFRPFGESCVIGQGVAGAAGNFEIAVRQSTADDAYDLVGETVTLLIQHGNGQEFLIARFGGKAFGTDSETGLESVMSLHLADAEIVVGNRYGNSKFTTSPAPVAGAFLTWISTFPAITDADKRLPEADADGDGRSNFLEYATGGNPASSIDPTPCQILADEEGNFWVRFSRTTGIGDRSPTVWFSNEMISQWQPLIGTVEPDPQPPQMSAGSSWMRIRVPQPAGGNAFFRLEANPGL